MMTIFLKADCISKSKNRYGQTKALLVNFVAIDTDFKKKPITKMKSGKTEKKRANLPRLELKPLVSGEKIRFLGFIRKQQ
ncbi:hypothetical protein FZC78_05850 [Rossellomorea vietnamensis]|uniref:Uncharacterized protein n=1 Tax=Rossellomorea vietnamensis TaxID=218284 RepID=A0A5D4NZ62_9BACI|nr:hypothetical protein [Rossellomorea vietnamensis]TYS19011.1 hypothetical protein FZC78_05850 [Rossellomorea vietnamensis]